jgi:hypothetical protein
MSVTDKHTPVPVHLPFASGVPPGAVRSLRQAVKASSQTTVNVDAERATILSSFARIVDGEVPIYDLATLFRTLNRSSGSKMTVVNEKASTVVVPSTMIERMAPNSAGWPSASRIRSTA